MSNLTDLVPPLELCKKIPAGEFQDSVFAWWRITPLVERQVVVRSTLTTIPAPILDEILDELHKYQEDVFLKWSETAYHGWLVNAYSHGRNEDYQAHDESKVTAALKVWLKMKGIEA